MIVWNFVNTFLDFVMISRQSTSLGYNILLNEDEPAIIVLFLLNDIV